MPKWPQRVLLVCALLFSYSRPSVGQVFNGPPLGYTVSTLSGSVWGPIGSTPWFESVFPTCAGGPDFQLTMAIPKMGVYAVSPGYLEGEPLAWQLASLDELVAQAPMAPPMIVRVVEYSQFNDLYYAAMVSGPPLGMDSLIVEFDRFGQSRVVLSAGEMAAYAADRLDPFYIEAAPDGTLWVALDGSQLTLLHVDPEAAEGSRVVGSVKAADVAAQFPQTTGLTDARNLGYAMTVDGQGRLFAAAHVYDVYPGTPRQGLYRFDTDGSITDMAVAGNVDAPWPLAATAFTRGIHWDPESGLIVGMGHGIHFVNPDRPGWANSLVSAPDLTSYVAADEPDELSGPSGVCSGPTWYGDSHAFVAVHEFVYYFFSYDMDLIDMDEDLLTGAEEARLGTDELAEDTDGGGIFDGAELIDYTDPTKGSDDRVLPQPAKRLTMASMSVGSEAWSEVKKGVRRQVLAHPSGELRLTTWANDLANDRFYRWRGLDIPAWMGVQKATETDMSMRKDGFVYAYWPQMGIVSLAPPGADVAAVEAICDLDELQAITGGPWPFLSVAATPDEHVYAAFSEGRLVHVAPDGAIELLYDAQTDLETAGIRDSSGFCAGSGCTCDGRIGPIVYEPVRGLIYFWVMLDIYCGNSQGAMSSVLMAIEPEGGLKYVGHGVLFRETEAVYGALNPIDMEPDLAGGLWVLGNASLNRLLYRIDANYQAHSYNLFETLQGQGAATTQLAHADDLAITPDGRLHVMPTYYWNQYPQVWMLAELAPVEPVVRAGEFLTVSPEDATLSRLLPEGGGMVLIQGEPLQSPEGVAATDERIAVSDSGRGQVGFISVLEDGSLGDISWVGSLVQPEGLDITEDGHVVVAESGSSRLVRIGADGSVETLLEGEPLRRPMDVVCLAGGELLVADAEADQIIHLAVDGTVTIHAITDAPVSLTVAGGTLYVSSYHGGSAYAYRDDPWGLGPLGRVGGVPPRAEYNVPGGIAGGADGSVVWLVMTRGAYDKPFDSRFEPTATEVYPIRFNPRGYTTVMARNGLGPHSDPGDVALVRKSGDPLPLKPVPVPAGPSGSEGDVSGDDTAGQLPCETSSGCNAGGRSSGALAILLVLFAFVFRRRHSVSSVVLASLLVACTGKTDCSTTTDVTAAAVPDVVVADTSPSRSGTTQTAMPDDPVVYPECVAPPCVDGTAPVCVDGSSRKRCYQGVDGCPVWSPVQSCGEGEECVNGDCFFCTPQCANRECGDDLCGGSCGLCEEDWCCMGGTCVKCEPDCFGKVCGPDWAGGNCGDCPDGTICAAGTCQAKASGMCSDLNGCLNDCPSWDNACWSGCFEFATSLGSQHFTQLAECTMVMCLHCWDGDEGNDEGDLCYQQCLQTSCLDEFATCTLYLGHLSCSDAYACLDACTGTDVECSAQCIEVMTPAAYKAGLAWEACMLPLCPDELGEEVQNECKITVAAGECADVYASCFGPCESWCAPQQNCGPDQCTGVCGICPPGSHCGNGWECIPLE